MESAQLTAPLQGEPVQVETKKRGISGSTIKIIAVAAMLIDHIAAALLTRILIERGLLEIGMQDMEQQINWVMENAALYYGMMIMRLIGRLGFPIFCFLLVEGFQKTRSVRKYAIRLGIFALVSEIPFDLATSGKVLEFGYQNVYFTLLVGILALCAVDRLSKHELAPALRWLFTVTGVLAPVGYVFLMTGISLAFYIGGAIAIGATLGVLIYRLKKKGLAEMQKLCASITAVAAAMLLADFLRTDYSGMGVLTIVMMYVFRRKKVVSMLSGCIVLTLMSFSEITAFFALIPIALYNGKRGLKMKYFFYAFYPVHLFLIWLVALLMGMGWISAIG